MGEVLRRSKVSAGSERCVAAPHQHLRERIEQRPTGAFTKCLDTYSGLEQVDEHDVLLGERHRNAEQARRGHRPNPDGTSTELRITTSSALNRLCAAPH